MKAKFLAMAALAPFIVLSPAARRADAAFEERPGLEFTLGGFSLEEDEGQTAARWNEYRDIGRGGGTLSELRAWRGGANRLTWWGSVSNPGYQDAEGSLHLQWKRGAIAHFETKKTPHNLGGGDSTVRERSRYSVQALPLASLGGGLSYDFEEKTGVLGGQTADQEWDRIQGTAHGRIGSTRANLEFFDSKLRHTMGGNDSDGFEAQVAGVGGGALAAAAYYREKTVDSVLTSVVPRDLDVRQSGVWSRWKPLDYFHVNASTNRSETKNGNLNGLGYESRRSKVGAVLKTSYARLGFNVLKKDVDKTNALVGNNDYQTIEAFFKGTPDPAFDVRAEWRTTDKTTTGVLTPGLQNAEDLASRTDEINAAAVWRPRDGLVFTSGAISKDVDFVAVSPFGVTDRSIDTRHQSGVWRINDALTLSADYLFQKLAYRGSVPTAIGGGLTAPLSYRIANQIDRHGFGLSYRASERCEAGVSYDGARSKLGDFMEPGRTVERNVEVWVEKSFDRGLSVRASVNHNSYFDSLDSSLSGVSDLVELRISKTIRH